MLVGTLHASKETAHLAGPGHGRKLVHRRDHEARQAPIVQSREFGSGLWSLDSRLRRGSAQLIERPRYP